MTLHEQAEVGDEFISSARRRTATNLRTNLSKIVRRAGITPWPKLFHNLRATLQTEFTLLHPLHVVCNWLGNNAKLAEAHYLSVPDTVFQYAAQIAGQQPAAVKSSDEQDGAENAENATLDTVDVCRIGRYRTRTCDLTGVIRAF